MNICFSISIDGEKIESTYPITYIETFAGINKIPYAIIRIHDTFSSPDKMISNKFKIGSNVEVELGQNKELKKCFSGVITKNTLKMDARIAKMFVELFVHAKAHVLTMTPQTASFKDKSDDAVIKDIISSARLVPKVGTMTLKNEMITQNNITSWDFINLRAEMYGFVVIANNDTVSVDAPATQNSGVEIIFGKEMINFDLTIDGDNQIDKSSGRTWDIKTQTVKEVKGETIAEGSFGNIKYDEITKSTGTQEYVFVHDGTAEEEIKTLGAGIIKLNRMAKIHGTITIIGNNKITPNTTIKISQCTDIFNGEAYVSGVKHIFDNGLWTTVVHIGLNGKRYSQLYSNIFNTSNCSVLAPMNGIKYGTVVKLDGDPKNDFRILVNIPTLHKSGEGIWCRFATLYASKDGGIIFFPEIGDEVIVGFVDDDPRYGVVLGSLYNDKNKPSVEINAKNETKKILTNTKMEITFDEKDKIISILTPEKNSIVISDKNKSITLTQGGDTISLSDGSIDIKCSKDITLNGKNITLKASGSVTVKASTDLKLEGNNATLKGSLGANVEGGTSANLKSSGMTAVKGAMVNIN